MTNRSCARLAVITVVMVATLAVPHHADAQSRETLQIDDLFDAVEIVKDRWGISHIYAENEHDLFFAQGYSAARDRLFQLEVWRLQATGSVVGDPGSSGADT